MNVPGGEANTYGTALVLITFLIMINSLVFWIAEHFHQSRLSYSCGGQCPPYSSFTALRGGNVLHRH